MDNRQVYGKINRFMEEVIPEYNPEKQSYTVPMQKETIMQTVIQILP